MNIPKYNYSNKYILEKIERHPLLYSFLLDDGMLNNFIFACANANSSRYYIDRIDFKKQPFMAFEWKSAYVFLPDGYDDWYDIMNDYDLYISKMYEEI